MLLLVCFLTITSNNLVCFLTIATLKNVWFSTMKRLVDYHLLAWKADKFRQPLLLRGARQVGKTYAVRELGKTYSSFVEINFEQTPDLRKKFEQDFDVHRIIRDLAITLNVPIIPGKTLLFFDEIQRVPNVIMALRYFYENMPDLHVIAAGSLLDFTMQKLVSFPVGRVEFLQMYPLSFMEFLSAIGCNQSITYLLTPDQVPTMQEHMHNLFLRRLGMYLAIGGMPALVEAWRQTETFPASARAANRLLQTYRQDFDTYATKYQLKYLEALFESIPQQLGEKFKYSKIAGDFRKRELAPCLDMLQHAGVAHRVQQTSAQGIPLGAGASYDDFKVIFIDVALTQYMLGLDVGDWLVNPLETFGNKGALLEAFVGQEMLAYADPRRMEKKLYYWQRNARNSEAEIDYVIQRQQSIIPIEVKSGLGKHLKSMHAFLDSHPASPYGIRFSTHPYSLHEKIHSYPLYAIAKMCTEDDPELRTALLSLL